MNAPSGKTNRGMILAFILIGILIIALVGGYFLFKSQESKKLNQAVATGYSIGYNKSAQDIAIGQTATGTFLIWTNNSVQVRTVKDICDVFIIQQLSTL
jgi:hypothetical protein